MQYPKYKWIGKIERQLESVKAFLPNDEDIVDLIVKCGLIPLHDNWRVWTDNSGNILEIDKRDKKYKTYRSKSSDCNNGEVYDFYLFSHPKKVLDLTKHLTIGFKDNIYFFWSLGHDFILRTLIYYTDINKFDRKVVPLHFDSQTLKMIMLFQRVNIYTSIEKKTLIISKPRPVKPFSKKYIITHLASGNINTSEIQTFLSNLPFNF